MRARLALLGALALLAAGCSSRPRANPFDPLNPSTSGRPPGFMALAGDRQVTLRWDPVVGGNFTGYRLYRRAAGEIGFTAITDVLDPLTTSFRDIPLVNSQQYDYRLYFVFLSGIGSNPSEDQATPGAAMPWLIESDGDDIIRVTPDNRRVAARRPGFGQTTDLAVNPTNGDVWVTDAGGGRVVVYEAASGVTVSIAGLSNPQAVAVDPGDATGWVCDAGRSSVYHLNRDGQLLSASIGPLNQPVDAAVDPGPGNLWVCELGANRVGRYDLGQLQWSVTIPGPSRVAVDSVTHEGWVTSFGSGIVTRVSPNGQVLGTFPGFTAPLGVAVDARRGRIWIADPYAGRITALRRDGSEEFRLSGLGDAGEIAVDPATGEAWAVLGVTGSVARLSPAGAVLRVQGGFQFPYAIGVDPGGR